MPSGRGCAANPFGHVCPSWGVKRHTITLASVWDQASAPSRARLPRWTRSRSQCRPRGRTRNARKRALLLKALLSMQSGAFPVRDSHFVLTSRASTCPAPPLRRQNPAAAGLLGCRRRDSKSGVGRTVRRTVFGMPATGMAGAVSWAPRWRIRLVAEISLVQIQSPRFPPLTTTVRDSAVIGAVRPW